MPEIKSDYIVSFSSEDPVHKAENILKPETYRKWKCATPGEKNAVIELQFERASQIHYIDIGNEGSAFVEVLVKRSADSTNDYKTLLPACSFMTPLESRNGTNRNRVRMFGPDKLAQNLKDQKWDRVQIVCTQPFNQHITYGLSFIRFRSIDNVEENKGTEEKNVSAVGSWFEKHRLSAKNSPDTSFKQEAPSYASAVLASSGITKGKVSSQVASLKRKPDSDNVYAEPPVKKVSPVTHVNRNKVGYIDVLPKKNVENKESNSSLLQNTSVQSSDKKKKQKPFSHLMKKVVFVLSGFVNPMRGDLRDKATAMGAKYKADWDDSCTHLVCAFLNTPKYIQVRSYGGRVVTKEWILDCYSKKELLPWRKYMLGKYEMSDTEESETEETSSRKIEKSNSPPPSGSAPANKEENSHKKAAENPQKLEKSSKENKCLYNSFVQSAESETEDEDAIEDYMADTDVDSDDDAKDAVKKVEKTIKKLINGGNSVEKDNICEKPNIEDLPLPKLPDFFKNKHFFLFGEFSSNVCHNLQRYITAYNGVVEDYMSSKVKFVVTESKWDESFDQAVNENEDLIFVKPDWIYKCHESGKLVPYQPFIIIPSSQ